jgi:hypothetical protein
MRRLGLPVALTASVLLTACVVAPPSAPNVMALPSQGKPYDAFQREDYYCRQAAGQAGGWGDSAAQAQNNAIGSAVVGTAVGAAAGALLGAAGGNAGAGAALGAGAGLLIGSSAGAGNAARGGYMSQQQYDTSYTQCMYAYGNTVQSQPVSYLQPYAQPYPAYGYGYGPSVVIGGGYFGRPYPYRRW